MKWLEIRSKAKKIGLYAVCLLKCLKPQKTDNEDFIVRHWPTLRQSVDIMVKTYCKNHACLSVTTVNQQPIISKEEYVEATVNVFNCHKEHFLSALCGIRVRGHTTAEQGDEKPYRLRFDSRVNLLGLHDGGCFKSWVLLRSYHDLARDYIAFKLYRAISDGKYYCSDCMFVNLFLNQEPRDVYVLCEQNQACKGRMEVYKPKKNETQVKIGYVLELDNYPGDEHPYVTIEQTPPVTDIMGVSRVQIAHQYSVKSKIRSQEQLDYISKYLTGVFEILYQASVNNRAMTLDDQNSVTAADDQYASAFNAVDAVIDLESLANMIILDELVQNYDVGAGGLYLAVDFSETSKFPRLTFLGPWDFNWTFWEDPDQGYFACTYQKIIDEVDRSNGWFVLAMRMDGIREIVKEKWRKLRESNTLEAVLEQVAADCKGLRDDLNGYYGRLKNAGKLVQYVNRRIMFLDRQWLEVKHAPEQNA